MASLWIKLGIFLVAGPCLNPHAHRMLSQLLHGQARGRQLIVEGCLNIAVKEMFAHTKSCGQVKEDLQV